MADSKSSWPSLLGATGWVHRLPVDRKHIRLEDRESEGLDAHKPRAENFDTFIEGSPNIFRENWVGIYLHQRGRENWRIGRDRFRWHHTGWQNGYKCWCRWGDYLLLNFNVIRMPKWQALHVKKMKNSNFYMLVWLRLPRWCNTKRFCKCFAARNNSLPFNNLLDSYSVVYWFLHLQGWV